MGREALVMATVGGERGEVRALLEPQEVILRGALRRRFPRAAIDDLQVADGALLFRCQGSAVRLELGDVAASAWLRALHTPPPSLRDKLGLKEGVRGVIVGPCDDPELAAAIEGASTASPGEAAMVIARVDTAEDLVRARAISDRLPLWAVYPKGASAAFGDTQVRTLLRAAGWRDTKTCAVSARLSATRYHPPRPAGREHGAISGPDA